MEEIATHDTDYVDVVVGYHHVLLLGLFFGVLMFATGYFIGSYGTGSDQSDRAGSTAISPTAGLRADELPPLLVPSTGIERAATEAGEAAKDTATPSAEALVAKSKASPTTTSSAAPLNRQSATATAVAAAEAANSERQAPALGSLSRPAIQPQAVAMPANPNPEGDAAGATEHYFWDESYQRFRNPQTQDSFKIYLRISSFRAQRQAEKLIQDLAADGIRALIEGQSVEGRHMVLIGPFADYQSATSLANVLKQRNVEAFPIRR